jgi:cell division protein FtsQ
MKNRRMPGSVLPDIMADALDDPKPAKTGRFMHGLRTVSGFVLVAGVSLAVAWGARRYLVTSPRFGLEQVVMEGQKTRTKDALLARAHIKMGDNVFSIDLDGARNKMLSDPYVKSATLARRLPDTILIDIEERVPAATVAIGNDVFLVTRDGDTFKRLEVGYPSNLPVITGLSSDWAENDREGFAAAIRRALDVAIDYQQSSLVGKLPLQEIHIDPGMAITLSVGSQNQVSTLVLGGPPFRKKLEQAARVALELEHRGQKVDSILLDSAARPERVVARVK